MRMFTKNVNIGKIVNMAFSEPAEWIVRYFKQLVPVATTILTGAEDLAISMDNGLEHRFAIKRYSSLSQERARDLIVNWQAPSPRTQLLVAVTELAPRTRDLLREHRVSWIERDTGICHIVAPGLFIDTQLQERTSVPKAGSPTRLRDRTGLIAEALLTSPHLQPIRLASITKSAGVSSALVSRVFRRLTKSQVLEEHGNGPNRSWSLIDFGGLLELWSKEEREPDSVSDLYVWSRSANALYEKLSELNELGSQWAMAGTSAAYLYAPILTAAPNPIVRLDAAVPVQEVAKLLGGEVVKSGANLQIWQSKGNLALQKVHAWIPEKDTIGYPRTGGPLQIISRPRSYIESINAAGRAPEVAQALREKMMRERNA